MEGMTVLQRTKGRECIISEPNGKARKQSDEISAARDVWCRNQ